MSRQEEAMSSKEKPDYYIERNGQKVPVFVINKQDSKPQKKSFLKIPKPKKKRLDVNPLEFMNWNETALYC